MFEVPSLPHLLMVLVIIVLLFGAKRVPEIAGSMGKGIREFRNSVRDDAPGNVADPSSAYSRPRPIGSQVGADANRDAEREPKRLIN